MSCALSWSSDRPRAEAVAVAVGLSLSLIGGSALLARSVALEGRLLSLRRCFMQVAKFLWLPDLGLECGYRGAGV